MSIEQKAKEISSALFKVAAYIRRPYLRDRIEQLSFQLAEQVIGEDLGAGIKTANSLSTLIELARLVNEIEKNNALILLREFSVFNSAMRQTIEANSANNGVPALDAMFSKQAITIPASNAATVSEDAARPLPGIMQDSAISQSNGNGSGNGITATIRQSAILDKIRQSGNLPLKDIIAAFPEVSERTMRYDLQKLCAQGLIERVGNGGPASYYVIK